MTAEDRRAVSRDAVVGFFDIAVQCAGVANDEPQDALDVFDEHVWAFVTRGGTFRHAQMAEALDRAKTLATYATYRYAKLCGTIATRLGEDPADWIRRSGESVMLGILDEDASSEG